MSEAEREEAFAMADLWDRRFKRGEEIAAEMRHERTARQAHGHTIFDAGHHETRPIDPDAWKRSDRGDGYLCDIHGEQRVRCCQEAKWGRFGAAGVLFCFDDPTTGQRWFMLNQRSFAINHGGEWSTLGGAIDRGESKIDGGMREAREETGCWPSKYEALMEMTQRDASGWEYTTILVRVPDRFRPQRTDWESIGSAWFKAEQVATLQLHPGFAKAWPELALLG